MAAPSRFFCGDYSSPKEEGGIGRGLAGEQWSSPPASTWCCKLDVLAAPIAPEEAAVRQLVRPNAHIINVHALGGLDMMRAAVDAAGERAGELGISPPQIFAVTILTSMDEAEMRRAGIAGTPAKRAVELAKLAKSAGLDGVVASGNEALAIRRACGPVPGRPAAQRGIGERDGRVQKSI